MGGTDEWRASVYDPRNQQRRYFSDPHDLSEFLTDLEPRTALDRDFDSPPTQRSHP